MEPSCSLQKESEALVLWAPGPGCPPWGPSSAFISSSRFPLPWLASVGRGGGLNHGYSFPRYWELWKHILQPHHQNAEVAGLGWAAEGENYFPRASWGLACHSCPANGQDKHGGGVSWAPHRQPRLPEDPGPEA